MKKIILILLLFYCSLVNSSEVLDVSMISVIADPNKYGGQKIAIVGYLYLSQQVSVICAYKDDFLFGNGKNCFNLDSRSIQKDRWEDLSEKYVNLSGTYKALSEGFDSVANGMVKDILHVVPAHNSKG